MAKPTIRGLTRYYCDRGNWCMHKSPDGSHELTWYQSDEVDERFKEFMRLLREAPHGGMCATHQTDGYQFLGKPCDCYKATLDDI